VLTARAEVTHVVDPHDAVIDGKRLANLQWLNGPALLVLRGQVKIPLVSGTPTEEKNGQYIPMAVTDKNGHEPLADMAYRLGISQVSKELDADVLHNAGVSPVLIIDPVQVNAD
jgi:hypothetical protein